MKRFTGVLILALLAQTTAPAQSTRRYTRPAVPSEAALQRLNLKMGWHTYVPTDGLRDGLKYVQLFGDEMLVQTLSGSIIALDTRDGGTLWRAKFGMAYRAAQPLGYNERLLFLVQGTRLFALDRRTGQQQWEFDLPNAPNAAPAADDDGLYVPLGTGKLVAYEFTRPPLPAGGKGKQTSKTETSESRSDTGSGGAVVGGLRVYSGGRQASPPSTPVPDNGSDSPLREVWQLATEARLEGTPLLTRDSVLFADTEGLIEVVSKETSRARYRFPTDAPLSTPLTNHGAVAYIASQDYNVYALDMPAGKLLWRFGAGGPILRVPSVTDDSVYLGLNAIGLYRIDRPSGRLVWRNLRAERFLAANKKFAYGLDGAGHLLVLDQARGRALASYDVADFNFPIANEWTDRLYLASHDGLIVCLHDRDYRTPLVMKTLPRKEVKPAPKPPTTGALPEPDEKPDAKPDDKPAKEKPEAKPDKPEKPKAEPEEKPKPKPKDKADDKPTPKPKAPDKGPDKSKDAGDK